MSDPKWTTLLTAMRIVLLVVLKIWLAEFMTMLVTGMCSCIGFVLTAQILQLADCEIIRAWANVP